MKLRVSIVSPFPPPYGGMSVLAQTLKGCLEKRNVAVIPINTHPDVDRLYLKNSIIKKAYQLIAYLISLRNIIKSDVILVISSSGEFFYAKALPALLVGKVLRRPVVLDFVGGGIVDKLTNHNTFLVRWLKLFDCILVPTPTFEKIFLTAGIPCTLFPHIVDIDRFSANKAHAIDPVLLAAKNLVDSSGIEILLRSYAEIVKKYPYVRFIIAGDGPNKATLQQIVRDQKLSGVEFVGNVAYGEMPALFEKATIFVHGTKYESFGIVLVEAFASGTPVVSTNVGGIPDIIVNGVNGYLVEYDDPLSMAKQVIGLIENKDVYKKFADNGLKTATSYSCQTLSPKLINILAGLLQNSDYFCPRKH